MQRLIPPLDHLYLLVYYLGKFKMTPIGGASGTKLKAGLAPRGLQLGERSNRQQYQFARALGRRVSPCRASLGAGFTISQVTSLSLASLVGSLATKAKVPALIASAAPLHALLLSQNASHAAWATMAALVGLTASFGGAAYWVVRSAWETVEPWILLLPDEAAAARGRDVSVRSLYGCNVAYSRLMQQPQVLKAAEFAAQAHAGQKRKTGEPYVTHCIETALIVEGLLSSSEDDERAETAVIAAILHDVVDDTDVEISELEDKFGKAVASLVAKVSQLSATNQLVRRRLRQSEIAPTDEEENLLREMILTMVAEPLAILIKLADRLHNMRTVYALGAEKRRAVADETRRVWCSLAERLGMFAVKSELEDLCFAVLQPKEYHALRSELDALWGIMSIPAAAVTPSDCCLTGECECDTAAGYQLDNHNSNNDEWRHQGARMPWLGSAHAPLPGSSGDEDGGEQVEGGGGRGKSHVENTLGNIPMSLQQQLTGEDSSSTSRSSSSAATCPPKVPVLTGDQCQLKELIESVLPFDASTFDAETLKAPPGVKRGLEVLQGCAKLLLQEITLEGCSSGLEVTTAGRVKSLYSIFKKMARKGIPLTQVYDARALRVVVDDGQGMREREAIAACYRLQPAVHRLWRRISGEEDDYITQPKGSGYKSLHTAVIGPGGVPMEIQIRTTSMHEEAEYGRAAHWAYKEQAPLPPPPLPPSPPPLPPSPPLPPRGNDDGSGSGTYTLENNAGPAPSPTLTPPTTSPLSAINSSDTVGGPGAIATGHPVLHISPYDGQLRDGVVVCSEKGGLRLLVAISLTGRVYGGGGTMRASAMEYRRILEHVEEQGFWESGQGDGTVALELYTLCSDGKYHKLDHCGHKLATMVVPLNKMEVESLANNGNNNRGESLSSTMDGGVGDDDGGNEGQQYLNERIRLLRSMLEWGSDLRNGGEEEDGGDGAIGASTSSSPPSSEKNNVSLLSSSPSTSPDSAVLKDQQYSNSITITISKEVMVLVWPGGRILRLPRGTTAGDAVKRLKPSTGYKTTRKSRSGGGGGGGAPSSSSSKDASYSTNQQQQHVVNVNNRFVSVDTPLVDGDYIVLSKEKLKV